MTDTTQTPATAGPVAGSPRTSDMPDDIRQHACTSAAAVQSPEARAAAIHAASREERLARKERAISGEPFGHGPATTMARELAVNPFLR